MFDLKKATDHKEYSENIDSIFQSYILTHNVPITVAASRQQISFHKPPQDIIVLHSYCASSKPT